MPQVADWLEKLGMSEYAQRFAENDIDFTIVGDLTDQDLEKIGVASLGHRRKLLRAIAALHAGRGAASAAPPVVEAAAKAHGAILSAAAEAPSPSAAVNAPGERRHVTVMFSDLVDSTGIAARLDAEEWRDLVGAYLDAASAAVTEMGGRVAKKLGDGLMALFGYPIAHIFDAISRPATVENLPDWLFGYCGNSLRHESLKRRSAETWLHRRSESQVRITVC
jgi:class 3 adenylate cyclase